jgi:hypothetical protein
MAAHPHPSLGLPATPGRGLTMIQLAALAALLTTLQATPSLAATWCVPIGTIGGQCPKVAPTIQHAIDHGQFGDVIRVGPRNPAERIVISKRVQIVGLPGHLITDRGLGRGEALITFAEDVDIGSPILERLVLDVVTSSAGIVVPSRVTMAQFKGVQITSTVHPRPAFGFQANQSKRTYFIGALGTTPRVEGFDVGIDLNGVTWHDVEAGTEIEGNRVGLRVTHGKGQIFWNFFHDNDVAIEVRGVFHTDINSNTFVKNRLAVLWGLAGKPHPDSKLTKQKTVEFNHPVLAGNDRNFSIETSPGVFSENYRDDPGCNVQWTNMLVDGDRPLPYHITGSC